MGDSCIGCGSCIDGALAYISCGGGSWNGGEGCGSRVWFRGVAILKMEPKRDEMKVGAVPKLATLSSANWVSPSAFTVMVWLK